MRRGPNPSSKSMSPSTSPLPKGGSRFRRVTLPITNVERHLGLAGDVTLPGSTARRQLWPTRHPASRARYRAPPRCPSSIRLVTARSRTAGSASSLGRRPPLDPACRCRQRRAPSGARASPAPRQSRTLVGLSRGLGRPGVGGSRWWPDHHRWLPGDLDHWGWPYGRALNSSTLTLITLARRPITANRAGIEPAPVARFCDSHSAPPNGDHHFPHSCTMRCERHPPVASAAALSGFTPPGGRLAPVSAGVWNALYRSGGADG